MSERLDALSVEALRAGHAVYKSDSTCSHGRERALGQQHATCIVSRLGGVTHCPCITCLCALSHAWHTIVHLALCSLQAILSFPFISFTVYM
jgi:hypothetical protein